MTTTTHTTPSLPRTAPLTKRDLLVPAALLALTAVPMVGGVARLMSLSAPATAESARFVASPAPVVLHIVGAALYCLLGAFQFSSGFRRRWPVWHRRAGKLLALCGLVTALTGMWMASRYDIPPSLQGPVLQVVRWMVGAAMVASILLGWSSILRREVARHEAWMIRAYALGQGAGTQVLVLGPWIALSSEAVGLTRDLLMSLAWAINIVVAEWIIRRRTKAARVGVSEVSLSTSRA